MARVSRQPAGAGPAWDVLGRTALWYCVVDSIPIIATIGCACIQIPSAIDITHQHAEILLLDALIDRVLAVDRATGVVLIVFAYGIAAATILRAIIQFA